jgi:flagellar biosynthetic protein FliO
MDGNIINAFLTLSTIVVAIGILMYILKKTSKNKSIKDELIEMKVLSKMALNQKNQVYIVQVGNKRLVLGVSDSGIRNLSELSFANNTETQDIPNHIISKKLVNDDSLSFKSFLKSAFTSQAN